MTDSMYVLGLWDGHDSGAALVRDGEIVFAANEERFTKRKFEVSFPYNSIRASLDYARIKPSDVEHVAFTTTEFAKTLWRVFPGIKESYYNFRRRKTPKPALEGFRHWIKYTSTGVGVLPLCGSVSRSVISRQLNSMGFRGYKLHTVEHHTAHAATAALTSPFGRSLVVTVDGLGDGLSASVSTFENGKLNRHISIPARDSLGVFYEQATNIAGMREQEDEGKLMAMADYSYPFSWEDNVLKSMMSASGTIVHAKYGQWKQYVALERIAWKTPREQFAYYVQQLFENIITKLVSNSIDRFGIHEVAMAGGCFSNVKANMMIRRLDALKRWYVFPHMGDGGIALGSALYVDHMLSGKSGYGLSPYLGPSYDAEETEKLLKRDRSLVVQRQPVEEHASHAAELISKGNYIMWFQDRMEYGPRALGGRSILAPSDSEQVKERLNLHVKRREWFQPFAPAILEEDVPHIIDYDGKGMDGLMTMAYSVREDARKHTAAVMHIDGTARPQMVGSGGQAYQEMLKRMKRLTGRGMVLNTSLNIHGMPIAMTPQDAVDTMKATKTKYMFIDGLFVTNRAGI